MQSGAALINRAVPVSEPQNMTEKAAILARVSSNVNERLKGVLQRVRVPTPEPAMTSGQPPMPEHLVFSLEQTEQNLNSIMVTIETLERLL